MRSAADAMRENFVLASVLELESKGEDLSPNLIRVLELAPDGFADVALGAIAVAIRKAKEENHGPADTLNTAHFLEPHYLAKLSELNGSSAGSAAIADAEAGELLQTMKARFAWERFGKARKELRSHPTKAEEIIESAHGDIARFDASLPTRQSLRERLAGRQFRYDVRPEQPPPRFLIGSIPICNPGNLTVLSGQAKAGKSAAYGAMISSVIAEHPEDIDCLGFRARNPKGLALLHLDTEQSEFDHDRVIRTAIRRARLDHSPAWLHSHWLKGFSVSEKKAALKLKLPRLLKEHGGIFAVLIDGVADFVCDVNDPEETGELVSQWEAIATEFNCPVICVLHFNPGTEKTRGHLGSQLERKAETNLKLELDSDGNGVTLWSDKNRGAPITKADGPRFAWSDEHKMFVTVQNIRKTKQQAQIPELLMLAEAVFARAEKTALKWSDFNVLLADEAGLSKDGARKRFAKMLDAGVVVKDVLGLYILRTERPNVPTTSLERPEDALRPNVPAPIYRAGRKDVDVADGSEVAA